MKHATKAKQTAKKILNILQTHHVIGPQVGLSQFMLCDLSKIYQKMRQHACDSSA